MSASLGGDEAWDAVVIGAGLGGLAAAARLARAGLRVLVAERHDAAGGYAGSFRRGPFTFEQSLHLLDAAGPGEPNGRLLERLGVGARLDLLRPAFLRREIWPDYELLVPAPLEAYVERLAQAFPGERAGLAALAALARDAVGALAGADPDAPPPPHAPAGEGALAPLAPLSRATAAAVVGAHLREPRLRAHLDAFARSWLGLPLEPLSASHFLVVWGSYHEHGGAYPRGGSAALVEALCAVIREAGGEIALSSPAERILHRRGRVLGVALAGGRVIAARAVISNVCPLVTFGELLDEDAAPPRYRRRLQRLERSPSCFKVWVGAAGALEGADYDVRLAAEGPHPPGGAIDAERAPISVVTPSALDPALVPPGRSVASISMIVAPAAYETLEAARPGARAAIADVLVRRAEAVHPGLSARAEVMEVATPRTFARFTGNPGGSIYGYSPTVTQAGAGRPDHVTPLGGLFLAGAWTRPGGGFTAALWSGALAARRALSWLEARS